MHIAVDPGLKALWPDAVLGAIVWKPGEGAKSAGERLWEDFEKDVQPRLHAELQRTELACMPEIGPARRAFKAFGLDPGRTRVSSEALYRRVRQGKDLYRVNAAVDAGNLVSLATGYSVGSYDLAKVQKGVAWRLGRPGEAYEGIGKGLVKLECMPLLADAEGPFGCPVSDSRRTMVGEDAARILSVIYGFSGAGDFEWRVEEACAIFKKYAAAELEDAWIAE